MFSSSRDDGFVVLNLLRVDLFIGFSVQPFVMYSWSVCPVCFGPETCPQFLLVGRAADVREREPVWIELNNLSPVWAFWCFDWQLWDIIHDDPWLLISFWLLFGISFVLSRLPFSCPDCLGTPMVWSGFNFSVKFCRNFGYFSFPLVTGKWNSGTFRHFSFSNLKIQKYL